MAGDGLPPGVRRSASGRVPQWAIDEALGTTQDPVAWRPGSAFPLQPPRQSSPPPWNPRPGRKSQGTKWAIAAGIALLAGLSSVPAVFERFVLPAVLPYLPGAPVPPPGFEAADTPLGHAPGSTGSGAYALQESPDPGQPFAAYDRGQCVPEL